SRTPARSALRSTRRRSRRDRVAARAARRRTRSRRPGWPASTARPETVRAPPLSERRSCPPSLLLPAGPATPRQGNSQRLEDRLQHVLRIRALDQADVQRQSCALRQLAQERGDDVAREAGDAGVAEVDVRDHEWAAGGLDRDVSKRLVRR